MSLNTRHLVRYGSLAFAVALLLQNGTARAQTSKPTLDDPTIVAIFDAANTYDMETGSLAVRKLARRKSTNLEKCWCAIIVTSGSREATSRRHSR